MAVPSSTSTASTPTTTTTSLIPPLETMGDDTTTYVSWMNIIPPPTHMVLPDSGYRGTCLGHAYAECITSRRRLIAYQSGNQVSSSAAVALPQLIHELDGAGLISREGLQVAPVSEYVQLHGLPLEGTAERAYVNGFTVVQMTEVQPGSNDGGYNVMNEQMGLLLEILRNGPVVGLLIAGQDWPEANGKVYYGHKEAGHKEAVISGAIGQGYATYGAHAVLIYGSSHPFADPFDLKLLVQDSMDPSLHTHGRARVHISAIKGYVAPIVVYNDPRKANPANSRQYALSLTITSKFSNGGGNGRVKYAVSSMQGWHETMDDAHTTFVDLDGSTLTSFFGIYNGHGGAAVAFYCARHMHVEVLNHPDYQNNPANALKNAFSRVDMMLQKTFESARRCASINSIQTSKDGYSFHSWPLSTKAPSYSGSPNEGSTACVILIRDDQIIFGNVGASRCVLSRNGQAYDITANHMKDHQSGKPETLRATGRVISDEHGNPQDGRMLELTKVVGYMACKNKFTEEQMVTCDAEVYIENITDDTEFLVIASDGIWDCMCSQIIVDFVHSHLISGETDLRIICESLLDNCSEMMDNLTVILVQFNRGTAAPAAAFATNSKTEEAFGQSADGSTSS